MLQQYVLAQNHPGLLDGIIPQKSYSDMIAQTIYVGDCMLMEYYLDVIAPAQGDTTFGGINSYGSGNPCSGSRTKFSPVQSGFCRDPMRWRRPAQ